MRKGGARRSPLSSGRIQPCPRAFNPSTVVFLRPWAPSTGARTWLWVTCRNHPLDNHVLWASPILHHRHLIERLHIRAASFSRRNMIACPMSATHHPPDGPARYFSAVTILIAHPISPVLLHLIPSALSLATSAAWEPVPFLELQAPHRSWRFSGLSWPPLERVPPRGRP